jgi:co-chaperonin GroES (HSP10)
VTAKELLKPQRVSELIPADKYTDDMKIAFPDVDPGVVPFGYLVLLQLRTPRKRTKTGLIIPDMAQDAERYRVQTGLVRAMGPSAFKRRDNLEAWPEGNWCFNGDFVRCPMYGGDRWIVPVPNSESKDDHAIFMMCKDTDLTGLVLGDPLRIITS